MEVEIPTRTAIIVMIVISVVYSTLTLVLCFCTCCHICKRKLKKSNRAVASISRSSELDHIECHANTWTSHSSSTDKESSEVSSTNSASNTDLHNRRKKQDSSDTTPGVDTNGPPEMLSPLRGGGDKEEGAAPQLSKHTVLPPIGQTLASSKQASSGDGGGSREPRLPSIPPTNRLSSVEGASVLPSTSDGFTILTVHKSTLKRRKKEAAGSKPKIDSCEDEKRLDAQDSVKALHSTHTRGDRTPHKKPKVLRTESTKPLMEDDEDEVDTEEISSFKPLSPLKEGMQYKKTRVARTESTKPLMGDEEDNQYTTTTGNPAPRTRSQPEISLEESALVLENFDAGINRTASLGTLQEDIMEIITAL